MAEAGNPFALLASASGGSGGGAGTDNTKKGGGGGGGNSKGKQQANRRNRTAAGGGTAAARQRKARSHSPSASIPSGGGNTRRGGGTGGGGGSRGTGGGGGGGGGRSRGKAKSKSPTPPSAAARRRQHHHQQQQQHPQQQQQQQQQHGNHPTQHGHHHHHHHQQHKHHKKKKKPPAVMTVVVNRVDLYDGAVAVKVEAEERMAREAQEEEEAAAAEGDGSDADAWHVVTGGKSPPAMAGGFFDDFAGRNGGQQYHQQQQQQQQLPPPSPGSPQYRQHHQQQHVPPSPPPSPGSPHHHHHQQHQHQHHYPNVSRYYYRATSMASSVDEDCYYSATSDVETVGYGGGGGDVSDRGAMSEPVSGAPSHHGVGTGGGGGEGEGGGTAVNVAVVRAPHLSHTAQACCSTLACLAAHHQSNPIGHLPVVDNETPNPHPNWSVHDKYWAQRRRLFSRFDLGVQLDSEGWYSVTPEIIADHVAARVAELSARFPKPPVDEAVVGGNAGIVVLDAFCGCGGNSIAFGKLPSAMVSLVVCVDLDRAKLRNAANNASLYGIPPEKLIFVECNTLRVMEECYRNGRRALPIDGDIRRDPDAAYVERVAGYVIGGEDMLPPHIDAVFIDPPWGGVDYGMFGKHGYDLKKNMKIKRCSRGGASEVSIPRQESVRKLSGASESSGGFGYSGGGGEQGGHDATADNAAAANDNNNGNGGFDDFFDNFDTGTAPKVSKQIAAKTMAQTEEDNMDGDCVDGVELLKIAASATRSRLVLYDLPKNTNKSSLGQAALAAGYRGNIKLEEHFLNGRLKTVTAYLGSDYSNLLH